VIDNAVSLFAGVGGFDLALERAGITTVATVEIDKAARGVLSRRFPDAQHFNDVTEVTSEQLLNAGFVPDRGVITGGFPCQDLSVAGKRAGLGGARSGLFWQIVRLARELQPRYLVLENVPGLLSSVCRCTGAGECVTNERAKECGGVPHEVKGGACPSGCFTVHGGAMGIVLGALVQLGYGIGFRVLDAQYFGVPQRHRRVFIVGCLGDNGSTPAEVLAIAEGVSGDFEASDEEGEDLADDAAEGVGGGGVSQPLMAHHGRNNADETLIVFDQVATVLMAFNPSSRDVQASEDVSPVLRSSVGGRPAVMETLRSHPRPGSNTPGAVVADGEYAVRRLTPMECERLQGFPDTWTDAQSDSARYKQMGNAVAVPVVEWLMKRLVEVDAKT
jgi:DNA (cytosine-5)-methyltransferase 1